MVPTAGFKRDHINNDVGTEEKPADEGERG
jgi:hypothetical protein